MSDLIRIGGLWLNTTRDGRQYITGPIGYGGKILIFENDHKTRDSDPDYVMYIGGKQDREARDLTDHDDGVPF